MTLKIILAFLILFAAAQFCFGQEKSEAILLNSFGAITQDDLSARVDNFLVELQNDQSSTGYVVIASPENLGQKSKSYLNWIGWCLHSRKLYLDRIKVIRVKKEADLQIEFWKTPTGVQQPDFGEQWPNAISKPMLFGNFFPYGILPNFSPDEYAKFLVEDSNLRGNIAIYNFSKREGAEEAQSWLKFFSDKYNLSADRFRFFYSNKNIETGTEFWLVPTRKNSVAR